MLDELLQKTARRLAGVVLKTMKFSQFFFFPLSRKRIDMY